MRIKEKLNAIDKALTIVENSLELFGKVSPNNKLAKYNLTQITYQETLNTLWDNQKNLRICAENYENIPFSR